MENDVVSLKEERKINASLEDLLRKKDEHVMLLEEKEDLLKSLDQSLKAPQLATLTKGDSLLKRRCYAQPSTFVSLYYNASRKIGHTSIMCEIKNSIANGACRWAPKEKMDEAKEK